MTRTNWSRIKHTYVTGSKSYREIAQKYKIGLRQLTEEAKKGNWVADRKRFRAEAASMAIARAREDEAGKLDAMRRAADDLGEKLEAIIGDANQLFLHTGVCRDAAGEDHIVEQRLTAINTKALTDLVKSLKDLTGVIRNLNDIRTAGEKERERVAAERLKIEREKADIKGDADREIKIVIDAQETEEQKAAIEG